MFTSVGQFITHARIMVTEMGGYLKQVCLYVKTFVLNITDFYLSVLGNCIISDHYVSTKQPKVT